MEIEAHLNNPYVKLDKENCILTIKGKSYPEHPSIFYTPIRKELEKCSDYMESNDVTINLGLEIINSVSSKYIYDIVLTIYNLSKNLNINWYYENDDEDMKEESEIFKSTFPNSNFNIISVEDINDISI